VVSDPQLTRIVRAAGLWFALGGGAIVAVLAARRLWTATTVGRRVIGPIGLPVTAAAVSQTVLAAAVLLDPTGLDRPQYQVALSFAQSASLLGLAAGVGWMLARERRRDTAVARIAEDLAAQPASLQATLARSLGDKNLQVAYRLPGSTLYVDAAGQPFVLQPGPGQIATTLTRAAEPVAVVVHDQALGPRLEQEIGAAARLAIDNERLRSALLWELDNLRASRLRVVEASDETRRALERDLHDGAQQRLLAVTFELRLALDEANASDNEPLVTTLAALVDDAQAALGELRDLAHGIFPAILDQAGLEAALSRLADEAALPVEIAGGPDRRLPADVEQTAYLVAASAVATATQHRAERLRLAVEHHDGRLIIGAMGAGADDQDQLADRVGALGGKLSTTPQRWRAEIPCE
jgi:signal transduction histidine kinase